MDLHPGQEQRQVLEAKPDELRRVRRVQENQDWYQDLVEHSHDLLCVHDLEGHLLSVNAAPARVLGYSVEELLEIPMRELIPPEFRSQFDSYLSEIESKGESRGLLALMTRSGERRIWQYYNTLRTEAGSVPIVRGIAHDVTEQLRSEKLLREAGEGLLREVRNSEQTIQELKLFRTLLDHSNDAIEVVDPETLRFLDVNEKACSALGYSREEMLALGVFDIDPAISPLSAAKIKEALQKSGFLLLESLHRRKNGSTFSVEVSMKWVRLDRDYIVAVARDLTERSQAEERLREYERVVEGLEEMIVVVDRDYRYVIANHAYLKYRGMKKEEVVGRRVDDLVPKEVFDSIVKEKIGECFRGKVVTYNMKGTYPTLGERDLFVTYFPMEGHSGVERIVAIMQDVTERKRVEDALRYAKDFSQNLIQTANVMILGLDTKGNVNLLNEVGEEITGYSFSELKGKSWSTLVPRDRFPHAWVEFDKLVEETAGKIFENPIVTKAGIERDIAWRNSQVKIDGAVAATISFGRDITETKRTERALQQQAALLNLAHDAILVRGIERSEIRFWNRGAVDTYGWVAEEALGRLSNELLQTQTPVPLSTIENQVKHHGEWEGELIHTTCSGKKVTVTSRWSLMRDDQGQPSAILEINRDITCRKVTEEALRRSEENYRMFIAQSSEGIFREDLDDPLPIDLPEDELIYHILHDSHLVECNDAMAAMYGLMSAKELQGKRLTEMLPPEDPHNIELTRHYIRSGFRALDRESHEIDIHGQPKVFLNSLIGTVEHGMLVRTWGIQRDVTEKAKLEQSRLKAEEALRENVAQLQLVTEELRLAKEKLSEEKLYLEQAIDTELGFGEIIGRSDALKGVMEKVAKVAPSDATVLLLGETGTGKELVARAIHRLSNRKDNSFIKLNCAAIPSGLLESELFGHEKGAFTGAVAKKLGRLELADHGTLFLDEIGEVSLDLQPKLLRVLQDQEFERLGGTQTLKVNFRLIAATNRDLLESVNRREFRTDLYYRLNVFPLRTPPLRERREDVPLLIEHFVRKYAGRMNKSILSIPARTMETLMQWGWPGNIRELENFVERSVILTPGSVLQVPLNELYAELESEEGETLRDTERERILRALRECSGQLGGPNGAAARLGLKRTTLQSKLNAFGIDPGGFRA